MAIPDRVLLKPGRLTAEEFETMKWHTVVGAGTMEAVRGIYPQNAFIGMGIAIALSHHERWDGGGYPNGLKEEQIPLAARLMALADVYDALRSKRCYKEALSHKECCDIIQQGSGTQFDPAVVAVFMGLEKEFERVGCSMADADALM